MENVILFSTNEKNPTLLDLKPYTSPGLILKLSHVSVSGVLCICAAERFLYSGNTMLDGIFKAEIRFSALIIPLWVPVIF
jgi:hypothetical protein